MTENDSTPNEDTASPVSLKARGLKKNHLWWQLLALLAVSFISVYASGAFDQEFAKLVPEKNVLISTYNKKQSGLSGLYDLLRKLGHSPKRWFYPYRQLSDFQGCLVVAAPLQSLKDYEVTQILDWVKTGNDLVYLDDFRLAGSRILPSQLDVSVKTAVKILSKEVVNTEKTLNWLDGVDSIRVSTQTRLLGGDPIASDGSGSVMTIIKHGKGRVILSSAPRMFSNDLIADSKNWKNFQLVENWFDQQSGSKTIKNRAIYFDERVHGLTGGRNVFIYLSRGPFGLVALQLILIVLVAFLSSAQRFGSPVNLNEARRISNMEFIDGLANAYRRARANASVLEILFHSFRVNTSKLLGVSAHEKDEELINAWNTSPIIEGIDLKELIGDYNRGVSDKTLSDQELQKIIATCDKITDSQNKGDLKIERHAKSS